HDIRKKIDIMLMVIIGGVSLFGYLTEGNAAYKFYYLPYRLFEFCAGSLVFYLSGKVEKTTGNKVRFSIGFIITYLSIVVLLFVDSEYMSRSVKLSLIVIFTAALLTMMSWVKLAQGIVFSNKWLAYIGAASFSIFVWHQVVVALIRYSFTKDITATLPFLAFLSITALLSYLSYKYVEQMKKTKITWTGIVLMLIVTTVFSLHIYINAGVVRDVPELEVEEGNGHRGMWAEYCDRGYQYDKDFTDSNRPKWYIIGNSFGRDMINVILESRIADMVEISYSDMHSYQNRLNRFAEADVVILSTLMVDEIKIADVQERCSNKKPFFIIGEKNFGECNGQVYRHRFAKDYHQLTVEMEEGYAEKNERLKAAYSDIYIDMIEMVRQPDGKVRVFSDDGRFISQDCRHLTKAGAQYYASLFEWERFLK
ncbi:MAG: acyltransferase family protein, partial [Prevotella sp.]